jgi:hypothetical protein
MAAISAESTSVLTVSPYYKFTDCCTNQVFNFRGTITGFVNNSVYLSSVNTGGLQNGRCYTVTQLNTQDSVFWNSLPIINTADISRQAVDCTEAAAGGKCASCEELCGTCPEGYTEIDGECVKEETIPATYSGSVVTIAAGDKVTSYGKFGLRLYPDITSEVKPLIGENDPYTLKPNNGTGPTVVPLLTSRQSTLWGSEVAGCVTGSSAGRLNLVGLWNDAYDPPPCPQLPCDPGPELAFEFCIDIAESKQYLIGIAGDNEVKIYVDGILNVYLKPGGAGDTAPFNFWHVLPITLTAGQHIIKLAGINIGAGTSASFGGEIYDIDLATFQATLTDPATGAGNCGNVIADLEPFIIFSTQDYIGEDIPNPLSPGVWECPDGSTPDYCSGIPQCTLTEKIDFPICPCFLLLPCEEGVLPIISNTPELASYVDDYVSVSLSIDGTTFFCVYVVNYAGEEVCNSAEEVTINESIQCPCPPQCYYISGAEGVVTVSTENGLQELTSAETSPYVKICSNTYPLVGNNNTNYQIVSLGDCIDGVCPQQCFKLTNCDDLNNFFFSNSDSLLQYVYGTNNIVQILNKPGCWEVSLAKGNCDCINVTFTGPFGTDTYNANSIGTYNGANLYQFTANNGDILYIWFIPEKGWYITANGYGDDPSAFDVAFTPFAGNCPDSLNEDFNWLPSEFIEDTIETEVCPGECDCPVDVIVTTSYSTCETCIGYIAYKLESCTNGDIIYTLSDLKDYVDKIIKIHCGCYIVTEVNFLPSNPQTIIVDDEYTSCLECTRAYWKLEDCAGDRDPIITYTDLSLYEGLVVKIENCTECWTVTSTDEHIGATTVVVTNRYADCDECGIPTTCECSRVTNLNSSAKVYGYYDCDNIYNEIKLEAGQTSDKVCALKWVPQIPFCECIRFDLYGDVYYAFIIPGELFNDYPVYILCSLGDSINCSNIYFQDGNWVIGQDEQIFWQLNNPTSTICPYGTWEPYELSPGLRAAAIEEALVSSECDIEGFCNCFTMTQSGPGGTTTSTFYVTYYNPRSNYPIYTDGFEFINYDSKSGCWYFPEFAKAQSTLCNDGECPIGQWESALEGVTIITEACEPTPPSELTYLDHFETFGECEFGNCPQPVFKNNRTIKPGYNTPICSPEKYDKITCKFADILYKIALEKRYGITNCCPEEDDKWLIQKELIDLQALKDPNYKCDECSCGCNNNPQQICNCKN